VGFKSWLLYAGQIPSTSASTQTRWELGFVHPPHPSPLACLLYAAGRAACDFISSYLILLSQRHQKSAAGNFRLLSSSSIQTCQQTFAVSVLRSPLQSGLQTANPPALQLGMFNSTASKLLQTSREFLPPLTRSGNPSDASSVGGEQYPAHLFSTVWCLVFPSYPIVGR